MPRLHIIVFGPSNVDREKRQILDHLSKLNLGFDIINAEFLDTEFVSNTCSASSETGGRDNSEFLKQLWILREIISSHALPNHLPDEANEYSRILITENSLFEIAQIIPRYLYKLGKITRQEKLCLIDLGMNCLKYCSNQDHGHLYVFLTNEQDNVETKQPPGEDYSYLNLLYNQYFNNLPTDTKRKFIFTSNTDLETLSVQIANYILAYMVEYVLNHPQQSNTPFYY